MNWLIAKPIDLPPYFFVQSTIQLLGSNKVDQVWKEYRAKHPETKNLLDGLLNGEINDIYEGPPEEVADAAMLFEGAVRQITVNAYERSSKARMQCIEAQGSTCCICGFNFGEVYGPEAEGYIHVHHKFPLSKVNQEYVVDPVNHLCPVCPNCHAILHLGGACRSLGDVKKLLQEQLAKKAK